MILNSRFIPILPALMLLILLVFIPLYQAYAEESLQYVLVGDSIIQGQLPEIKDPRKKVTIQRRLEYLTSTKWENKAVGGTTTNEIAKEVVKLYEKGSPKVIVANGGINDIGGSQTKKTYLDNWKAILDLAKIHNTRLIILLITPWTNGSNERMIKRDDFNKSLIKLAKTYPNVSTIDSDSAVGEFRLGGPPKNKWDIKNGYSYDGVHFTSEGYVILADIIASKLSNSEVSKARDSSDSQIRKDCPIFDFIFKMLNLEPKRFEFGCF